MSEMVTGSRLHFGLFEPARVAPGERRYGGAGMMIDRPGIRLQLTPSSAWTAEGYLAERALMFAHRCLEHLRSDRGLSLPPHHLRVVEAAPEHAGLGTGSQLGLAVARLLTHAACLSGLSGTELAYFAGRGRRSGLGVHGFESGGFLVDGGRGEQDCVASLLARRDVPATWRVVIVLPPGDRDWHGKREQSVFERLESTGSRDRLQSLVTLGLLPALLDEDLLAFSEALCEFNRLAGEPFASAQGGCYAGPRVAEAVAAFRVLGVNGTGQSSWGPAVFGIVEDADRAAFIAEQMRRRTALDEKAVLVAAPLNRGAILL